MVIDHPAGRKEKPVFVSAASLHSWKGKQEKLVGEAYARLVLPEALRTFRQTSAFPAIDFPSHLVNETAMNGDRQLTSHLPTPINRAGINADDFFAGAPACRIQPLLLQNDPGNMDRFNSNSRSWLRFVQPLFFVQL